MFAAFHTKIGPSIEELDYNIKIPHFKGCLEGVPVITAFIIDVSPGVEELDKDIEMPIF